MQHCIHEVPSGAVFTVSHQYCCQCGSARHQPTGALPEPIPESEHGQFFRGGYRHVSAPSVWNDECTATESHGLPKL